MAIEIASSFGMKAQLPLDERYVVADLTARDAIDSGVRHEGMQVYVEADEKVYFLKGGVANSDWQEMGSGAGGSGEGSLNYVENGNAEAEEASPFIPYSAGASYPVIWGESFHDIDDEVIRDTTNVIRGAASWSTNNTGLGDGYLYDFAIDEADLGAVLSIDILYRYLAPGVDGDWAIWIYDIDNSAPIKVYGGVAPFANNNGSELLATEDIASVSFRFTATDSLNYRLLIHNCVSSVELNFEVRLGPKESAGGAGSGGINLESSPFAQDGLNGWALFDDGATAVGVDLTGGTASAVLTAEPDSEAILNGEFQGAYKLAFTAADHQGEGGSKDFDVPRHMRDVGYALVEMILSPSAAIATGDFILRAYDVTNSAFLTTSLTDHQVPAIAADKTSKILMKVNLASDTASLRIGLMRAVTTASAVNLYASAIEVGVGKSVVLPGTKKKVVIDLAGSGNFTSGKIIVSRDGADILISQLEVPTFSSNHSPASAAGIIPTWAIPAVVHFSANFTATLMVRTIIETDGTFSLNIRDHSGATSAQTAASVAPLAYSLDEDDGGNIVDVAELGIKTARVLLTSSDAPAIGTTIAKLTFTTATMDDLGLYSSGTFTAPETGLYDVEGFLLTASQTWAAGNIIGVRAYVDSVADVWLARKTVEIANTNRAPVPFGKTIYLERGQTLEIWAQSDVATTLIADADWNSLSITARPGLSVIAAIAGYYEPVYAESSLHNLVTGDDAVFFVPTGASVELEPGVWEIHQFTSMRTQTSGASELLSFFSLSDSSIAEYTPTIAYSGVADIMETTDQNIFERADGHVYGITQVTETTTLYGVVRVNFGTASGSIKIRMIAKRIA